MDGIELLREMRGTQQVTFAEICDHLFDYVERHPEEEDGIHSFAEFLTAAELVPHDHDADPRRGLPRVDQMSTGGSPRPARP